MNLLTCMYMYIQISPTLSLHHYIHVRVHVHVHVLVVGLLWHFDYQYTCSTRDTTGNGEGSADSLGKVFQLQPLDLSNDVGHIAPDVVRITVLHDLRCVGSMRVNQSAHCDSYSTYSIQCICTVIREIFDLD